MSIRTDRLRQFLADVSCDAMLVSKRENVRYYSGFTGSNAQLLITAERLWLLTDFRYVEQAAQQAVEYEIIRYSGALYPAIAETLATAYPGRTLTVGFEGDFVVHDVLEALKAVLPEQRWQSCSLESLRMQKDSTELELIRQSMNISQQAFAQILPLIKPGARECDIALELEFAMRRLGADGKAFDFIVASGPRGALPHGVASEKTLEDGELVTLDFGAVYKGYHSDMTRTVCLGAASPKQREVYELVLAAQLAGCAAVRPAISGREVDAVARQVIINGGYGEQFGHGLGHGLGLMIHEEPRLSPTGDKLLAVGMPVTVEPGIYIPGWGGVRIEDTVVVSAAGCVNLTAATAKELLEIR